MKSKVIEYIVNENKCIGCGVCAAVCPNNSLLMSLDNNRGLYQPIQINSCIKSCHLCIEICPFNTENLNSNEINQNLFSKKLNKFEDNIGFYNNCYVAYRKNDTERLKSASGGIAYWLLCELLKRNEVDAVITVKPNYDSDKLFQFSVFDNIEKLKNVQGSVYYPVELSDVLGFVKKNEKRYAITVLPCYANSIRLAQRKSSLLKNRIIYVIGLVCGQLKNKFFTEELGKIALGSEKIEYINYRTKQINEPATKFAYSFRSISGNKGVINWKNQPSNFWRNRLFTPLACNKCTDVFAYCADVVLMDAWLPEYSVNFKGHSLVITRKMNISYILEKSDDIFCSNIPVEKIIKSQISVIENKNNIYNYSESKDINFRNLYVYLILRMQVLSFDYNRNKFIIRILELLHRVIHKLVK